MAHASTHPNSMQGCHACMLCTSPSALIAANSRVRIQLSVLHGHRPSANDRYLYSTELMLQRGTHGHRLHPMGAASHLTGTGGCRPAASGHADELNESLDDCWLCPFSCITMLRVAWVCGAVMAHLMHSNSPHVMTAAVSAALMQCPMQVTLSEHQHNDD